jgi:hypothetical protein
LGQAVTRADDAALGRVVALLDGLKNRGAADELLARARHRLHGLRPPRPLAFTRLLFVPLDGVVVPASKWRRGEGQVPRSALPALAAIVHAALGAEGESLAAECAGRIMADADAVERVGRRLWPAAARVLPAAAPPAWEAAGLLAADYREIAALCRPVWTAGPALQAALAATGRDLSRERAAAALAALAPAGPECFAAGLATLMEAAPLPGQVAQVAAGLDPRLRAIAVRQAEAALDRRGPEFDLLEPLAAAGAALSLAVRLDDLEACGLLDLAARRRLHALRRGAEEACWDGFFASVERQVLAPLAALTDAPEVADETVAAIEAEARGLARLESAGRRLGEGGGAYDRARRAIAEALALLAARARHPAAGLRPMDLARVAEILAGTEEAAALLAGCGRAVVPAAAAEAQPSSAGTPAGSALPAR